MAKILDSKKISTYVPRLIEVGNYFIINGLVHNKNNFKPSMLDFEIINTGPLAAISLKQTALISSADFNLDYTNASIYDTELVDSEDPNIIYKSFIMYDSSDVGLCKFRLRPDIDSVEVVATDEGSRVSSTWKTARIIGQNKDYLFISASRADTSYKSAIYRVNKATMAYHAGEIRNITANMSSLLETDTCMYDIYDQTYSMLRIRAIDKNLFTEKIMGGNTSLGGSSSEGFYRQDLDTCIAVDKTIGSVAYTHEAYAIVGGALSVIKPAKVGEVNICRFDFNVKLNVSTPTTEQVIDLSKQTDILAMPVFGVNSQWRIYKMDVINYASDEYLLLTILNVHPNNESVEETSTTIDDHLSYFFKIKRSTNTLELVSSVKHGGVFNTCMLINSGRTFVLANKNSFKVFTLDTTTMKYAPTYTKGIPIQMIGIDTLNRVHVSSSLGLDYFTLTTPIEMKVSYEKEYYDFISSVPIETYILVSNKDMMGRYRSSKIRISLKGPQVFKSNNSNIITINTSQDGETVVPIILKDEGFYDYVTEIIE